jgi:hypothetical protein
LAPHHHEGFVGGDAKKPGGERRISAEGVEFPNDLQQGGLEQVPTVLFRDGVASELALNEGPDLEDDLIEGGTVSLLGVLKSTGGGE